MYIVRTVPRQPLRNARRIVIKLGTRVLTEKDNVLSDTVICNVVSQTVSLLAQRKEVVIVSSAAIALGLSRMGLKKRPKEINLLQAAASLGQSRLMHAYEKAFAAAGCETAQMLLTIDDIKQRDRYLNIRNTILTLWEYGAVPVVNENDSVSFEEITFGDNDVLAAHLANMIDADLLVLMTDIDGLYDRNPKTSGEATIIRTQKGIGEDLIRSARGKGSIFSSGGMDSKLRAARVATQSGIGVIIANGRTANIQDILAGKEIGTYFVPVGQRIKGRKKWIAFNPNIEGRVVIDAGGESAIVVDRKSLLPAGVVEVAGTFPMGSNVSILNESKREIARGLINFSSEDLDRIKGLRTEKIPQVLGTGHYFEEVVHRDNMVIITPEP